MTSKDGDKTCARCGAALFPGKLESFELLGCGSCGGAWLDHAAAGEVMSGRVPAAAGLSARLAAKARPNPALLARTPACPDCGRDLTHVQSHGVSLDVCPDHGTWFDRGEIDQVMRVAAPPAPLAGLSAQRSAPARMTYPWLNWFTTVCKVLAIIAVVLGLFQLLDLLGLFADEGKKVEIAFLAVLATLFQTTVQVIILMAAGSAADLLLDMADRPVVR